MANIPPNGSSGPQKIPEPPATEESRIGGLFTKALGSIRKALSKEPAPVTQAPSSEASKENVPVAQIGEGGVSNIARASLGISSKSEFVLNAQAGNVSAIKAYLKTHAKQLDDVEFRDAVKAAADKGHLPVLKELLGGNRKDKLDASALTIVVRSAFDLEQVDAVQFLLSDGRKLSQWGLDTCLTDVLSKEKPHPQAVKILIQAGAKPTSAQLTKVLARKGDEKLALALLKGNDPILLAKAALEAAKWGFTDRLRILFSEGRTLPQREVDLIIDQSFKHAKSGEFIFFCVKELHVPPSHTCIEQTLARAVEQKNAEDMRPDIVKVLVENFEFSPEAIKGAKQAALLANHKEIRALLEQAKITG